MTKEDIKKALEICTDDCYSCDDCPYDDVINCGNTLKNDVRELIVEQEKEIERLETENGQRRKLGILGNEVTVEFLDDVVSEPFADCNDIEKYAKQFCNRIISINEKEIKQAKIDVLNKAKEKLDSAPNGWAYTTYIDELIEEVQNDK